MRTLAFGACALIACSSSGSTASKPTGTPSDPVEVCERIADVCKLDGSRLGVCIRSEPSAAPAACGGRTPCFVCMSQH